MSVSYVCRPTCAHAPRALQTSHIRPTPLSLTTLSKTPHSRLQQYNTPLPICLHFPHTQFRHFTFSAQHPMSNVINTYTSIRVPLSQLLTVTPADFMPPSHTHTFSPVGPIATVSTTYVLLVTEHAYYVASFTSNTSCQHQSSLLILSPIILLTWSREELRATQLPSKKKLSR